jgi:hypothetical protein
MISTECLVIDELAHVSSGRHPYASLVWGLYTLFFYAVQSPNNLAGHNKCPLIGGILIRNRSRPGLYQGEFPHEK